MANKKQNHSILNQEQIQILLEFIIEKYGTGLLEEELIESISVVMEHIPGIEMESTRSTQQIIHQVRNQYYGNKKN